MHPATTEIGDYLQDDDVIDWSHPEVGDLAGRLLGESASEVEYAEGAFLFARDAIRHSWDVQDRRVTLSASEVLREGVGLCFGKAHLLVALLRVQSIPAGLCYQKLRDDAGRFALHGLVAVHLDHRWSRLDPRGNKAGVDAQFDLDVEKLAWPVRPDLGERDYPAIYECAQPEVVAALTDATDMLVLCCGALPNDLTHLP